MNLFGNPNISSGVEGAFDGHRAGCNGDEVVVRAGTDVTASETNILYLRIRLCS